ncbi:MAG: MFS transporter [Endozoicomonas sp. (ex Botrylloides leachii)]|nr:MFS transporter [Endozoicomonas sp. (ex Botrylloides leachii)]
MLFKKDDILLVSCLLSVLVVLSTFLYVPSLPFIEKDFGNKSIIALSFSAFLIANAIAQLSTPLCLKGVHKNKIFFGCFFILLGSIIAVWAESAFTILIARVIQGAGAGICSVTSKALLRVDNKEDKLQQRMARLYLVVSFVPIAAPLIGSGLQVLGSWRFSFFTLGAVALISIIVTVKNNNESLNESEALVFSRKTVVDLCKNNLYMKYGLLYTIVYSAQILIISVSPFIIQNFLGFSLVEYGLVISSASFLYLIGSYLASKKYTLPNWAIFIVSLAGFGSFYKDFFIFGIYPAFFVFGLIGPSLIAKSLASVDKKYAFTATSILGVLQLILSGLVSSLTILNI